MSKLGPWDFCKLMAYHRRVARWLKEGKPLVAYMAHPYSGNPQENVVKARMHMAELHQYLPRLVIINPLDNFKAIDGETDEVILPMCKALIAKSDLVIFTGDRDDVMKSKGCAEEFAAAHDEYLIPCFSYQSFRSSVQTCYWLTPFLDFRFY